MNDLSSLALMRGLPPRWRQDAPRRIGAFVVQPASNELVAAHGTIRLRPRLMDVLLRLAAEPGVVIARNRLLEEVWPRRMVSDEVLSRTIAELRTALGDDPRHPAYIETIPTVGYRLIAAVVESADALAPVAPAAAPVAPATAPVAPAAAPVAPATAPAAPAVTAAVASPAVDPASAAAEAPIASAARVRAQATPAGTFADASAAGPANPPRTRRALAAIFALFVVVAIIFGSYRNAVDARLPLAARLANATPLSSNPGLEMEPRYAPDGRRIAYSASKALTSPAHLVVWDLGASTARREIGAADDGVSLRSPVFVGGSARLAYASCGDRRCRIVQRDLDDGSDRVLVPEEQAPSQTFDVSADGRYLVYANMRRPQFPAGLALLDLATGATRDLSLPDAGDGDDQMPRFSADASRIAFFRGGDGMQELWTMRRDGTRAEMASNARGAVYGAAWRDARHVVVAADWFGFRSLNDVDLATHSATFVGARGARFPDVAPNGDIVYENAQFRADLWPFDPASATLATGPAWPSTRFTMNPEYSPDGTRIVFVSNREGAEALFVAIGSDPPTRLKLPEGYRYVNAHWSHDGRALYAMRLDANPPHAQSAVRIDADTGATEPLPALGSDVVEVIPDRAGRYLYWAAGAGSAMRLMRAPAANTGLQERLPLPLVDSFALDATHIAFTQPQIRGLTLCGQDDMACDSLPLPISDATRGAWTLGAGSVWYLDTTSVPGTLARYDYAEHRVTLRSPARPMAFGRSIAVSPAGDHVMLARQAPTLIDLMIAH